MSGPLPDAGLEDRHLALAFAQKPLTVVRASGAELELDDGRIVVDLGGASHGVASFGHGHPRIAAAIAAQAARGVHLVATVKTPARGELLERLHRLLPRHLTRSFLANSGSEAVEAAIKYACAATGRSGLVAARQGFHGRTLGALAVTHRPAYRTPFQALLPAATFVPYGDLEALGAAVSESTAAVLLEPIQGEGGVHVPPPGYLAAAARIAHARGTLLVVDEVQTGLGRTGFDLAVEAEPEAVAADLLLLGKSLAGGLPIGVAAMTEEVARAMPPAGHGGTFGGSPLVAAAASAALEVLWDEKLAARALESGAAFRRRLEALDSPLVREVRGRGLLLAVDLKVRADAVLRRLLDRGFLALPAGSTVIRFLPPLGIHGDVLAAAARALAGSLAAALAEAGSGERRPEP